MIPEWKIYPRSQGHSTVYLQNVVTDPAIQVGAYTIYDDFVNDPRDFQRNNVLYHYPCLLYTSTLYLHALLFVVLLRGQYDGQGQAVHPQRGPHGKQQQLWL